VLIDAQIFVRVNEVLPQLATVAQRAALQAG